MAARKPASPPSAPDELDFGPVRIERIGADGDGIARGPDDKPLFLPDTLPGERVRPGALLRRGDGYTGSAEIIDASPDRVTPPCPHFGPCGGCTLQHWRDDAYADWKLARAEAAAGLRPETLSRTPPGTRRRIDVAIRRDRAGVQIGLHRRRSPDIVDMRACPILHPSLFTFIQAARAVMARLDGLRRKGEALLNLLDTGPDVLLRTDAPLSARDRIALAKLATGTGASRISWRALGDAGPEPAATLRPSIVEFAGYRTEPPPGAFLQASAEGEQAIVAAVLAALPTKFKGGIVELFAGCGSLTHALATRAVVTAYEGDPAAAASLRKAANPRVRVTVRDLARQPLAALDLKGGGAVVLDPPFGGALAQMPALAASGLPVIYVSCNPGALIRDQKFLLNAGYKPNSVAAIDQFLWSSQVETVVGFVRP